MGKQEVSVSQILLKTPLGSVVSPRKEKGLPSESPDLPFIGLQHIEAHTMRLIGTVRASTMRSNANRFYTGDVLYARLRPYLNKVYLPLFEGYCSGEFIVFPKTDGISPDFLKYRLNAADFVSFASHLNTGDRPRVDFDQISSFQFFLPPLSEQHRIVAKIEELFSSLDKGIESLKTAQQQLKVYRQAVLKWAFEGKLTNKNVVKGELPDGWKCKTFNDVCDKVGDVDHKMPKQVKDGGIPYVSTKDFTKELKISFENVKYISNVDYLNLSRKIKPEKGDIIFPRYGTIGKNILIDFDKKFLVSYSCAIVKPNNKLVDSKYIYYYSLSPKIHDEIKKYTVETTQANIGIASIKRFIFLLPPTLEEQHAIIAEIESRLSVCDKIEESIEQSLKQAEALRQSILKKAFEGRLVPQDPNDEPASKLLERIKAGKEKAVRKKRI